MKCLLSLAALLACAALPWSAFADEAKHPTFGKIERADPRFDKFVPPDAKLELLAEGFDWSEGPVWDREGGFLLFSDIPPNKVMKWKEGEGLSTFLHPAGYTGSKPRGGEPGSNGLLFDKNHKLVAVPARRPADRATRGWQVRDRGRSLRRQAVQQPERRRVQVERRSVLHRSAVRPRRRARRSGSRATALRRLPRDAQRRSDAALHRTLAPQRHRPVARREDPVRGQLRRRGPSGWPSM